MSSTAASDAATSSRRKWWLGALAIGLLTLSMLAVVEVVWRAHSHRVRDEAAAWDECPPLPPELTDRIAYFIARINDDPDYLHFESTPAVWRLEDIGPQAIPPLLEVMATREDAESATLLHAQTALYMIVGHALRRDRRPRVSLNNKDFDEHERVWKELGDLTEGATKAERIRSVETWRRWMVEHQAYCPNAPFEISEGAAEDNPD